MNEFYPLLDEKAKLLATFLSPVAFVLVVASLWGSVSNGNRSATMYLKAAVHAIVVVIVLSQFPVWLEMGEKAVDEIVNVNLQVNPAEVYEKYKSMTGGSSPVGGGEGGFWDSLLGDLQQQLFKAIISALLWSVQLIAKVVVFIAYIIYQVVLAFAVASSPIFIGFLSVRSLSSIGSRFILGTVGILLWPLGWAFAALVTDTLLELMAKESFVTASGMEGVENLLGVAIAGFWIVFSTIASPLVIQKMISEGINAGAALLHGGMKAARAGAQSGATTGATLASGGAAAPLALAGAAGAGALAMGSSSLSGAGYSSIGDLAGNAVRMGKSLSSPKSSGGGGGGGKKAGSSSYSASDPANDNQAATIVANARKSNRHSS